MFIYVEVKVQFHYCRQNLLSFRPRENPQTKPASCSVLGWKAVNSQKNRW